jgi:hypothetical protein
MLEEIENIMMLIKSDSAVGNVVDAHLEKPVSSTKDVDLKMIFD